MTITLNKPMPAWRVGLVHAKCRIAVHRAMRLSVRGMLCNMRGKKIAVFYAPRSQRG